jgi:hypothetical protein
LNWYIEAHVHLSSKFVATLIPKYGAYTNNMLNCLPAACDKDSSTLGNCEA